MNPSDQRFDDRMFKRIAALEKQLQDIKTAQRMGLDNFEYDISDVAHLSTFLAVGQEHIYGLNFNADVPKFYVGELSMAFFFNNDQDPAYHWPDGSMVTGTSSLNGFEWFPLYDRYYSDETGAGRKTYYLRVVNYGSVGKTIHTHIGQVFPKGGIT